MAQRSPMTVKARNRGRLHRFRPDNAPHPGCFRRPIGAATLAFAAMLAVGVAACGDSSTGSLSAPPTPVAPTPTEMPAASGPAGTPAPDGARPAPASDLPSVELVDVATGATVNLAGFAPSGSPSSESAPKTTSD